MANSTVFVPKYWWIVIPLSLIALILAHVMALIFRIEPAVSLWFPPAGVAIALTLWFGPLGVLLTGIASVLMAPLWGSDGWTRSVGLIDMVEPLISWLLYRYWCRSTLSLNSLRDAAAFTLSAPLAGAAASALVGSFVLVAVGKMSAATLGNSISQWWLGNALGTLAIAPSALLILTPLLQRWGCLPGLPPAEEQQLPEVQTSRSRTAETAIILLVTITTAMLVVSKTDVGDFEFQQFSFLSFVPIVWAATRFGIVGGMLTSSFCVFVTLVAYLLTYPHSLSLANFPVQTEILYVHKLSLLVQCAVGLFIGTATTERTTTQVELAVERVRLAEYQAREQLTEQLIQLNSSLEETHTQQQETLAMLDALLESSPVGISFRDRGLRCLRVNESLAAMNGVSREQLLGRTITEAVPQLAPTLEPLLQRILETAEPALNIPTNNEATAAPGEERYWLGNYYPVRTQAGEIIGVGATIVEITELKKVEKALTKSESRFRQIVESGMIGISFGDLNGNIVQPNDAYLKMLGYNSEDLPQENLRWDNITPPEYHPLDRQALAELEKTGLCSPYEKEFIRKDGSRFPVLIGAAILESSSSEVVAFILDISERKRAEEALRYLAETSSLLATSLDYEATLERVAQIPVPQMADWCSVDILQEDGSIHRLPIAHADRSKAEWAALIQQHVPDPNGLTPVVQVLKTGQSILLSEVSDSLLVASALDAEHLHIMRQMGMKSGMVVPLIGREQILGTMTFVTAESNRRYQAADLAVAEDVARRAALAIENAKLYQEATQARQEAEQSADRTARLQAVTASLSEPLTAPQVAEVIVEQGIAAMRANSALVALLVENDKLLEIVSAMGYDPDIVESWRRFPVDTPVPLADAVRTGEASWCESTQERIARYPHLAQTYANYNFQAWISIPLVVEGKIIGGMSLSFTEVQKFSSDDRTFALALSQQCAQAIARARLYEAEKQAREMSEAALQTAEAANRIKDEFLAVLSHELRSPLNPILGWTKLLRSRNFDAAATDRALEIIERNAKLQTQLIEDLLDISRILRGKLSLRISQISLPSVIDAAMETMRLAAEAKSIELIVDRSLNSQVPNQKFLVSGDASRLQQVVWNLLSNAIKFTPEGGRVEIYLTRLDGESNTLLSTQPLTQSQYAQIKVKDTGKGISPEFLPYVFEHFRQADASITRTYGGLGLGLAIVRHLVELHGGSIHAESLGEGQGSTFTVTLPLLEENKATLEPESKRGDFTLSTSRRLEGVRVVIVDDDADAREFLAFVLEDAGAIVKTATSANEVLEALPQFKPDVLVSDIGMPQVDGYTLMGKVRSLSPKEGGSIPAVALTAYAREEDIQQALLSGFQLHLSKPVDPGALVDAIANLSVI